MRILYYNLQLGCFDGSNAHAAGMLNALREIHGAESVLVGNDPTEQTYSHQADVLRRALGRWLDPIRVVRRQIIARRTSAAIVEKVAATGFEPDVILARGSLYDYTPSVIAKKLGCPLVLECNTPLVYECCDLRDIANRGAVRRFERAMLAEADGLYCVSKVLADMLSDDYAIPHAKIRVVPNGYSNDTYNVAPAVGSRIRMEARTRYSVGDRFVVAFVGSLQTWHGIPNVLELAAALDGQSDVEFWIIGDGFLRDSVREYVAEHANMRWFGNVPALEVRDLLYAADLGIMPYTKLDKFYFSPLKLFEMIGAGLPFIATDVGQIAEFCRERLDGSFLFSSPTVEEMRRALMTVRAEQGEIERMQALVELASQGCSWLDRGQALALWMEELVDPGAQGTV